MRILLCRPTEPRYHQKKGRIISEKLQRTQPESTKSRKRMSSSTTRCLAAFKKSSINAEVKIERLEQDECSP